MQEKLTQEKLTRKQFEQIGRVLSEPRRVEMLKQISANNGTMSFRALLELHNVQPSTLSHHLNDLEVAGLIDIIREGRCATVALRREILRAYLDELSGI